MEWFTDTVRGYAVVRIVGAEPTRFLEECANRAIEFWGACPEDEFTLVLSMRLSDAEKVPAMAEKSCCEAQVTERRGGPEYIKRMRRRFALWVLPFVFAALLIVSSFFVWDIEIVGNETVSDVEILNALEESGVYIGSFWPSFTSESIRSLVLMELPELKWLSVSVFGSHAHVEVRERTAIPEIFDESEYYNIVASRGGLIDEIGPLLGNGMFSVGQTVDRGDMLISGVMESTFGGTRFVHARGRVMARTWYELTAVLPLEYTKKEYTGKTYDRFSLVLGENRINFYRNSGILRLMCDNIIREHKLGVEGLFSLPVSIVRERSEEYELVAASRSEDEARRLLEELLYHELERSIGADGQVLESEFTMIVIDGCAVVTLRAQCRQNIAAEQPLTAEEISRARAQDELEDNTD